MDLDTKRYRIQKNDCESLDEKFNKRFAKFSNIENAIRNHSQYPATGFHAVVTKKFDSSLSKKSTLINKTKSKAIGSIQSIESMNSIHTMAPDKSLASDYQTLNTKKVKFDRPAFLKNATNISSLQVLEKDSDIMSQHEE